MAASGSVSVALSVTSTVSCSGATSWRRTISSSCAGSSASSRLRAERLIATSRSRPCRRQLARSRTACSTMLAVSGAISAVCSTIGTNSAGASRPLLGVLPADQRLDARHPAGLQVELGLVVDDELAPLQRGADLAEQAQPLRGRNGRAAVSIPPRCCRRPGRVRARPRRARISSWAVSAAGSMWAMPMLTSTFTPTPLSTTGASSARWTALATLPRRRSAAGRTASRTRRCRRGRRGRRRRGRSPAGGPRRAAARRRPRFRTCC